MRLLLVTRNSLLERDGGYYLEKAECQFLQELATVLELSAVSTVTRLNTATDSQVRAKSGRVPIRSEDVCALGAGRPDSGVLNRLIRLPADCVRAVPAIRRSDVVFLFMPNLRAVAIHTICQLFGKPTIVYFGSDWTQNSAARKDPDTSPLSRQLRRHGLWLKNTLQARVVQAAQMVVVRGEDLHSKFNGHPGLARIGPISSYRPEDTMARPRNKTGPLALLYVGRLEPSKGVAILLEAVSQLVQEGCDLHLTIVGGGSDEERLRRRVTRERLDQRVRLSGYLEQGPDLTAAYEKSDVLVLPSLNEGLPRVLLEAQSHGLAVISTRVGGVPWAVEHEAEALLVEPGSSTALGSAIRRLIADPALRIRIAEQGQKKALNMVEDKASTIVLELLERHFGPLRAAGGSE